MVDGLYIYAYFYSVIKVNVGLENYMSNEHITNHAGVAWGEGCVGERHFSENWSAKRRFCWEIRGKFVGKLMRYNLVRR